ncbi:hypothetical protein L210DRAFT_3555328 [Boletus edulis BED1]|uniref:Uncharacterized protein n=1 Tax=Boletus edulis BED1 TaxID=1328754 RepID=A0AAD4GB08_BOLED|nr:hypothetical protein L210DRAFT_3555328 [Boletus edulis BED1]
MFTCLTAVTRAATLLAFTQRRLSAHGDAASNTSRDANMSTIHTTLPPLLREWAEAKLTRGSWKDALLSAVGFTVSRVEIYSVVIEHLETIDRIVDAVECVHEMTSKLGEQTLKLHDDYLAWAFREKICDRGAFHICVDRPRW